jgi:lysozyme family protein
MTMFEQAFAILIGHEGGYDTTHDDPGNWTSGRVGSGLLRGTKFGISAGSYPSLDVAAIQLADAQAIYKRDFWDPLQTDDMPPPLALLVFDAAVNNGKTHASTWLQIAVGADPDGQIGPRTLQTLQQAASSKGGAAICAEFMAQRLAFMSALPTWRIFGLGWSRRLCALPYQSLSMGGA